MARSKRNQPAPEPEPTGIPRGWGEFLGIALLAIGGLMCGGLFSYQFGDGHLMGPVGRLAAGALYAGFGMAGYLVVLGVVGTGVKALMGLRMELRMGEGVGFTAATVAGCILLHVSFPTYRVHGYTAGGLAGELLGEVSLGLFDHVGTYLVCVAAMTLGLIASTPLTLGHLLSGVKWVVGGAGDLGKYVSGSAASLWQAQREAAAEARERRIAEAAAGADDYEDEYEEDEAYEDDAPEAEYDEELEADEEYEEYEEEAPEGEGEEYEYEYEYVYEEVEEDAAEQPAQAEAAQEDPAVLTMPEAPAKKAAKPRNKKTAALPEIVLPEEPVDGADGEAKAEEGGATQEEAPAERMSAKGKKAPPRPGELAAKPADEIAEIAENAEQADLERPAETKPARVLPPRPEPPKPKHQVQYLTSEYKLPPLELFQSADKSNVTVDKEFVYEQARRIEESLAQFRVQGKVTKIHPGPVITRYEFKPEAGTKVAKIQNLENDLAMALEAIRIRILAPIPGKNTVGLEVPNASRETVYFQEIIGDEGFGHKAALPMALGKGITGQPESLNLAKAPHLLVAGATGSGKSVGVNSMICTLLKTCTPEEVRMILIDPKMLEFSIYADIPHLLLPVITDAEKANMALRWAVAEMERRYALLSEAKVRNLEGYNEKVPTLQEHWEAELRVMQEAHEEAAAAVAEDGEDAVPGSQLSGVQVGANGEQLNIFGGKEVPAKPDKLPFIVIVIDEFADLMMVASKEVEANVARIAAKARAAGIHLIVATQRPSVDVITGTIKNNFPSRIAFQVTSDTDSRTILDQKGAKQLLGMGDMLYMDRGKEPKRVHGCYVSEREIEKVVDFIKKQAKPSYDLTITEAPEDGGGEEEENKSFDPFYDKAVAIVSEAQKVSTSMLQRRLGVGYNRAAKIVECMEEQGVIGPANGTKPREVFVGGAM